MMNYFKGGRGKKAPYETIMLRVPLPLKPLVLKLAEEYRLHGQVEEFAAAINRLDLPREELKKLWARLETGDNDT